MLTSLTHWVESCPLFILHSIAGVKTHSNSRAELWMKSRAAPHLMPGRKARAGLQTLIPRAGPTHGDRWSSSALQRRGQEWIAMETSKSGHSRGTARKSALRSHQRQGPLCSVLISCPIKDVPNWGPGKESKGTCKTQSLRLISSISAIHTGLNK